MKIIVCLDDNNGMLFNNRRQSRDKTVVEDIISVYQNSTDKDGFDITNLTEEEKEKIENSDIAKAILDALFK